MKIINFPNYSITEHGVITNDVTGRILKPDISAHKYPRVTLCKDGTTKRFFVHRLVAIHFINNPDDLPMVNHIDGVKANNHISNLEWCTCKENTIHAFKTGLRGSGEKHYNSRLSNDLVRQICEEITLGKTRGEILLQERFSTVTRYQFDDIRSRKSWITVSRDFNWT